MAQSPLEARVAVTETKVLSLEKTIYGNGQPGLEAKMATQVGVLEGKLTSHIERVERHTKNNMEQGDGDLAHEIEQERAQRERMHAETGRAREKDKAEIKADQKEMGKKIDRLMYVMGGLNGALLMFKILEDAGFIHMAGAK